MTNECWSPLACLLSPWHRLREVGFDQPAGVLKSNPPCVDFRRKKVVVNDSRNVTNCRE
jgi:hypothetical protein